MFGSPEDPTSLAPWSMRWWRRTASSGSSLGRRRREPGFALKDARLWLALVGRCSQDVLDSLQTRYGRAFTDLTDRERASIVSVVVQQGDEHCGFLAVERGPHRDDDPGQAAQQQAAIPAHGQGDAVRCPKGEQWPGLSKELLSQSGNIPDHRRPRIFFLCRSQIARRWLTNASAIS